VVGIFLGVGLNARVHGSLVLMRWRQDAPHQSVHPFADKCPIIGMGMYRKTPGRENTIRGIGDVVEGIQQRAVEIKDESLKRHGYNAKHQIRKSQGETTSAAHNAPAVPSAPTDAE